MISWFDIATLLLMLAYSTWILFLWNGWKKKIVISENAKASPITISVVIAFRNEAENLEALCNDLLHLEYPKDCFEIILVNDDSEDGGEDIVRHWLEGKLEYNILRTDPKNPGKKAALSIGIEAARLDWILTTDADCRLPVLWLQQLANAQSESPQSMWCGRVFYSGSSLWDRMLQHEFATVIGTGAATLQSGYPTMCNGANLAFQKEWFYRVGGYSASAHLASGDDEFLMHRIFERSGGKVQFLNHRIHTVLTQGPSDVGSFLRQRIRWASKWQHYQSSFVRGFALLTFMLQAGYLVLPLGVLYGWISTTMCLLAWGIKITADGIFMHSILKDFERRLNFFILLCLEVFYPFYVVSVGLISRFVSYSWKGRKWK